MGVGRGAKAMYADARGGWWLQCYTSLTNHKHLGGPEYAPQETFWYIGSYSWNMGAFLISIIDLHSCPIAIGVEWHSSGEGGVCKSIWLLSLWDFCAGHSLRSGVEPNYHHHKLHASIHLWRWRHTILQVSCNRHSLSLPSPSPASDWLLILHPQGLQGAASWAESRDTVWVAKTG